MDNEMLYTPESISWNWVAAVLLLTACELVYFQIARKFSIIDIPNSRSSHTGLVIRGGGIVFYVALVAWFIQSYFSWPYFMVGATSVAIISFADDITPQRARLRFLIHAFAVACLFYDAGVYAWSWALVLLAAIICIGALNAFNFMDGINGITGVYAGVNLVCFGWIQYELIPFSSLKLIGWSLVAVVVFLFFNFRAKAKCFAGDSGSVTMAFIQIFLLVQIIVATQNFWWVLFFWVYGIDSVVTILHRLLKHENIFKPHRTHLYQYLCNELRWPHRGVAGLYGITQLVINAILIVGFVHEQIMLAAVSALVVLIVYLIIRLYVVKQVSLNSEKASV